MTLYQRTMGQPRKRYAIRRDVYCSHIRGWVLASHTITARKSTNKVGDTHLGVSRQTFERITARRNSERGDMHGVIYKGFYAYLYCVGERG